MFLTTKVLLNLCKIGYFSEIRLFSKTFAKRFKLVLIIAKLARNFRLRIFIKSCHFQKSPEELCCFRLLSIDNNNLETGLKQKIEFSLPLYSITFCPFWLLLLKLNTRTDR